VNRVPRGTRCCPASGVGEESAEDQRGRAELPDQDRGTGQLFPDSGSAGRNGKIGF
jgi:hypothetical protein